MPKIENFWDDYGIKNPSNIKLLPVLGQKDSQNPVLPPPTDYSKMDGRGPSRGVMIYDKDGIFPFKDFGNVPGRLHYIYFGIPGDPYPTFGRAWNRTSTCYAYSDNLGEKDSWVKPNLYIFDFDPANDIAYRIPDKDTWTPIGDGGANNIIDISGYLLRETEEARIKYKPDWDPRTTNPANYSDPVPGEYQTGRKAVPHIYNFFESDPAKKFIHFVQSYYDGTYVCPIFHGFSSDGVDVRYRGTNNKISDADKFMETTEINSHPFITHDGKLGFGIKLCPFEPNKYMFGYPTDKGLTSYADYFSAWMQGYFEFELDQDLGVQFATKYPDLTKLLDLDWGAKDAALGGITFGTSKDILDPPDTSEGVEGGMHDMMCIPVKDIWGDHYVIFMDMYQYPGRPHPYGAINGMMTETALFGIRGTKFNPKAIKRIGTKFLEKVNRPTYVDGAWDYGNMFQVTPIRVSEDHFPIIETETEWIWFYSGFNGANWQEGTCGLGRLKWRKNGLTKVQNLNGQSGSFDTPLHTKAVGEVIKVNYKGNVKLELLDSEGVVIPGYSKADCTLPNGDYLNKVATWGNKDARELTQFKMKWYLEG